MLVSGIVNSGPKFCIIREAKKIYQCLGTVPYPPYKSPALLSRVDGFSQTFPFWWDIFSRSLEMNQQHDIHPSIHPLWQSQCFFWHFLWVFPKMVGFPPITAPPSHGPFLVGKNPMVCWVPNPPFVGKPPHISRKLVHLRVVDQSSLGIGRWEWSGKGHRAVRMQPLCLWQVRCRSGAWGRSSNKKREELHDYGHDLSASMRFSDWVVVLWYWNMFFNVGKCKFDQYDSMIRMIHIIDMRIY